MWYLLACSALTPESKPLVLPRANAARLFHTLTVDAAGGGSYTSIEDAIEDARSGDTVSVAPGTYEGFSFEGKSVWVRSTGGAAVTTIVAADGEPAIKVKHGEGAGTVLEGFTITGGGGEEEPAIEVEFSAIVLRDDIISGNGGTVTLYSHYGHTLVDGTTFTDNTPSEGMIIQERRGMTLLKDTFVSCGTAPIGYITEHGGAFVDGSTFDCPGAIAVEVYHSDGRIQRSVTDGLLVVENESLESEHTVIEDSILRGGASLDFGLVTLRNVVSTDDLRLVDSTVTIEGSVVSGATCGVNVTDSTVTVRNTVFWDNAADTCGMTDPIGTDGSFAADPRFVDAAGGDFRLASGSPCTDAGPTGSGYPDPDGSPNDIGAYGGPLSMGGGW